MIEAHDATALMSEHDEHEEDPECGGWDNKKVASDDILDMIVEKGLPRG
jgi:hypothetical protein